MDANELRRYLEFYQDLGVRTLYRAVAPVAQRETCHLLPFADLHAELAVASRERGDVLVRFAVASERIVEADEALARVEVGPPPAHLRPVEDLVRDGEAGVERQQALAFLP